MYLKNQDAFERIKVKLKSDDYLIRCDTVSDLAEYRDNQQIQNILTEMLSDKNYLVRCDVCDALYGCRSKVVLNKLIERIKKERSSIARMYILSTISSISDCITDKDKIYEYLYSLYVKETAKHTIVAYMALFYVLKKDLKYIYEALYYIDDEDYHIRCNVINLLSEIVDNKNITILIMAYNNRLLKEEAFCVKVLLEESLLNLRKFNINKAIE